jgi:hypothetical protein
MFYNQKDLSKYCFLAILLGTIFANEWGGAMDTVSAVIISTCQ